MPLVTGHVRSRTLTTAEAVANREDYTWRSLGTGGRVNDLNPAIRDRAQRLAVQMAMKNMLARRLIKLRVNYVIGSGLSIVSDRPEVSIALSRWWSDPYNAWPKRFQHRLFDLYTKGEWLHRPLTDTKTGFVRIADINTDAIADVLMDERDHGIIDKVVIRELTEGTTRMKNVILPLIRHRLDPVTNALEKSPSGDVWLHTINRSATQTRGSSELTSLLDYLESVDKAFYARIDMLRALASVYFDLEIEGMSEEQMRAYTSQHKALPPRPGTVWAHSPNMIMKPMTPDFRSNDMERELRLFQSLIVGSDGWPGMLFDDPGSAGRAIGSEMVDSAMRNVVSLQQEIDPMLSEEMDYHLDSIGIRTRQVGSGEKMYRIIWAKPSIREAQRYAPAIERITKSIDQAGKARLLTREEQRSLLIQQITELGISNIPMKIELPVELEEENDPPPPIVGGQQQNGNRVAGTPPVQIQARQPRASGS